MIRTKNWSLEYATIKTRIDVACGFTTRHPVAPAQGDKSASEATIEWARHLVDAGGVAVEDAAAADLDGDGDTDIVAAGRATKNVRIYWNELKKH